MAKTENRKLRFNIFDALIILAVIACVAAVIIRFYFISSEPNDEQITVSFVVPSVMKSTADKMTETLKDNKQIYLVSNDTIIGYIISTNSERSVVYGENSGSEVERVYHPDRMDIKGTAVLYGKTGENGFYIGSTSLATISEIIYVYSDEVEFSMTISSISAPVPREK